MAKSADAFRTISEVAEALETQPHVLRFWESKFSQVKPVKRAGGRRYYRPADMALLAGIKTLLHDDGVTIKGVQKILRKRGVKYVSNLAGGGSDGPEVTVDEDTTVVTLERPSAPADEVEAASAETTEQVLTPLSALRLTLRPQAVDQDNIGPIIARLKALHVKMTAQATAW